MFKKGDEVYCASLGDCVVIYDDNNNDDYPIVVQNEECNQEEFTAEGRFHATDIDPSLFHAKPYDELPPEPNRLPELEMDAKILVRDGADDVWIKRHFKKWNGTMAVCWNRGTTSWFQGASNEWNFWKLPEDRDV